MGRLDGKVAVITGAGLGMGRQGAIIFTKEGAKVVAVDWDSESGEETVRMIKKAGNEAVFVEADVSKSEDVKKMINTAVDNYSKLDILYNKAGIAPVDPILESTEEKWEKVIGVNLKGVWLGMKYAIPEMLKSGGGSIINIGSVAADRGFPGLTSYTASKGGILSLTRAVAVEFASKNIRVNCICPGVIATRLTLEERTPEELEKEAVVMPMRRFGQPDEVPKVALFLASDDSSYVTGQTLAVDGGWEADAHIT